MSSAPPSSLHPAALPVGTLLGCWRIAGWAGRGSHGVVYRAVPADREHAAPVALKLALLPRNPRFAREAELLSRLRNGSIPRFWEQGEWQSPSGDFFPYVIMEWVDGLPLYAWARQQPFSLSQASQMLAHLARALQGIHAQGAVHRDVKGDNILVRRMDGRAMLIDFGTGLYPEAETLTPPDAFPGTPAYRSPESGLFELQNLRARSARYRAGPADDLYALGVTACRWLTSEYPQFSDPFQDAQGLWRMESVKLPQALAQLEPSLRAPVQRLLSVRPEERGSVQQFAEEMERLARPRPVLAVPAAEPSPPVPSPEVKPPLSEVPVGQKLPADSVHPRRTARWMWPALATAAASLAVALWASWGVLEQLSQQFSALSSTPGGSQSDAGTAGLGDTVSTAASLDAPEPSLPTVAEESLPEPIPGQTQPDSKGRCPLRRQVALNGACWVPIEPEECAAAIANGQLFRGKCYVPALPRGRRSTSEPNPKP
ncbi:serine/threonine-protein kinase [Hyalangium versicolor]|uniref:serine/threonine-protein kinase n=1 Tax=Hyalangium versicolor TaxID=2861190 RepID=UPI001CCC09DD|nr:serine/threonine-protein kinase [Hyalangium versicolor]